MVRTSPVIHPHNLTVSVREMVCGDLTRLRFVVRYSNCPRIHDENVAEHSYYTALYAYMIASDLVNAGMKLDVGMCVGKALMHDVDECFSGDFIRSFKHSNKRLKEQIGLACQSMMGDFSKKLTPDKKMQDVLYSEWNSAKAGEEGRIVALCDFLSVVSYIAQETDAGNHRMNQHLRELRTFHSSFGGEEYDFLRLYLFQAGIIINEMEARHVSGRRVQ